MDSGEKLFFNGDSTFSMPCHLPDLKKIASKWSLAGDAQLLGFMQNFSNKIISQTEDIHKQLNSLTYKTKIVDVKLNNVFNSFNALANTQFVENRVYDEDPCIIQQHVKDKPKLEISVQERDAQMMMMMNKAVTLCKKVITMPTNDERKGRYVTRELPQLLNSQRKVGNVIGICNDREQRNANQIAPSLNNSMEDLDKLSQASHPEVKQDTSSLESSLKAESFTGRKPDMEDLFTNNGDDSDNDLFSKPVKVSKARDREQFANSLDATFKINTNKTNLTSSPASSSSLTSDRLVKENKGKVKSLFDESDSGEEDILTQISNIVSKQNSTNKNSVLDDSPKKVPIGGMPVFGTTFDNSKPPSSGQSSTTQSLNRENKLIPPPSTPSLFESRPSKTPLSLFDDDDDDDLFSSTIKKAPFITSDAKSTPQKQNPIGQREVSSQRTQKPIKSLFDEEEEDDDDDIFSKLIKQSSKTTEVKETKNEAKPSLETRQSVVMETDTKEEGWSEGIEKKSEVMKQVKGIFDEDDDYVPFISNKAKIQYKPVEKIKSIFDDDDDGGDDLFDIRSEKVEEIANTKSDVQTLKPSQFLSVKNPRNESLFDDDDDDLFSNLAKGTPKLELPTTSSETLAIQASPITITPIKKSSPRKPPTPLNFVSPHKTKGIAKIQTSLNINPLSLGPYSHKNFKKEKNSEVKVDGSAHNEMTGHDDDGPRVDIDGHDDDGPRVDIDGHDNDDGPRVDGLDVGRTCILPSLVKGRPKMIGRRRPTTQTCKNYDDDDLKNESNVKADSVIKATPPNNPDFDLFSSSPKASATADELSEEKNLFNARVHQSNLLFDELEVKVDPPFEPSKDLFASNPTREEIKNFFDTSLTDEHLKFSMMSHNFEPPPLFSDDEKGQGYDDDDEIGQGYDDDDEDEDLFSDFNIKIEINSKNMSISKNETNLIDEHKTEVMKNKPMFSFDDQDDDDDDDLFANLKLTNPIQDKFTVAATTNAQSKSIFDNLIDDEDDLFADVNFAKKDPTRSDRSSPGHINGPSNSDQNSSNSAGNSKPKILFNDDDDDDLFSSKFVSKNLKAPTKAVTKDNLFGDSDDDIFTSPLTSNQSSKDGIKSSAPKFVKDNSVNLFEDPLTNL